MPIKPSRRVYVVIPFKDEPQLTSSVVRQLQDEGGFYRAFLYDNGSAPNSLEDVRHQIGDDGRFEIIEAAELGIYAMWNAGWEKAIDDSHDCYVLFLNNDITFGHWFVQTLSWVLDHNDDVGIAYPNYDRNVSEGKNVPDVIQYLPTRGTYKDGGMCGWAFMLRGRLVDEGLPFVDENLQWWYGDDHIEMNVRNLGYMVVRVLGIPVDHINEATARNGSNEWTHASKEADVRYWAATYGG